jgi:nucleotide-binding universal stress UspA family protein
MEVTMLYRTILCATDGLEHSDRALGRAARMAGELDAELHVLHIGQPMRSLDLVGGEYVTEWAMRAGERSERAGHRDERAERVRDQLVALMREDPDLWVVPRFVAAAKGSMADQIAAFAERIDADLIVVGSRRRGPIGEAITGSTAQRLPNETKRPVLVLAGESSERPEPAVPTSERAESDSPSSDRPSSLDALRA